MLPKPPRLLVEPLEVEPPGDDVVVPPVDEGDRPTTVGVELPVPVGVRAVVVPRLPPHHHKPGPEER